MLSLPGGSVQVVYFLHVGPPDSLSGGGFRLLAGIGKLPPFLSEGILCHTCHVCLKIIPGVFQVAKEQSVSIIDGIIPDITGLDHAVHPGPWMGMEVFVFLQFLSLDLGDPAKALYILYDGFFMSSRA